MENSKTVTFSLGGMIFEYDEKKNKINIEKHGISFKSAARVFFDYDRIEYYDEENSNVEDRYDIIGDLSAGTAQIERNTEIMIGNIKSDDVLFVVYTERIRKNENGICCFSRLQICKNHSDRRSLFAVLQPPRRSEGICPPPHGAE